MTDRSDLLDSLSLPLDETLDPPLARADEVVRGTPAGSHGQGVQTGRLPLLRHPRDARIIPQSRDFH